jgi:tyrosyl-DNA phosphodiesterase-1
MDRPSKRSAPVDGDGEPSGKGTPVSLTHPISPPLKKRRLAKPLEESKESKPDGQLPVSSRVFRSPFQLTKIRDLPPEMNRDTVTLKDILGDPLIAECWEFNYLHDIDFLMAAFDQDVRHLIKVHVVHGFWKREDPSRLELQVGASTTSLPLYHFVQVNRALFCSTLPICILILDLTPTRKWHPAIQTSPSTMPFSPRCLAPTTPR